MLEQGVEGARRAAAAATAEWQGQQVAAATAEASHSEAAAAKIADLTQPFSSAQQQLDSLSTEVAAISSRLAAGVSREEYSSLSSEVSGSAGAVWERLRLSRVAASSGSCLCRAFQIGAQ